MLVDTITTSNKLGRMLHAWDKTIIDMYIEEFDDGFQRCVENTQLLWMLQRGVNMPMEFK